MKVQRYSSTKTLTLASMKNAFCNIVDGNRVSSGMCACAHLHRSMLVHICFVGSALLPGYLDLQKLLAEDRLPGPEVSARVSTLCSVLDHS